MRWLRGLVGRDDAALAAYAAAAQAAARVAEAAAERAVQAALVAAEVARQRGVGDGGWVGLDSDLETLDPRR